MSKMIQIRNVPDDIHRRLKVRAASEGMTLSDYLLAELTEISQLPTLAEMRERLARLEPVGITAEEVVRAIHEGRAEREEAIARSLGGSVGERKPE